MQIASAIGLKGFAVVKAAIDDEDDYTDSESVKGVALGLVLAGRVIPSHAKRICDVRGLEVKK
jgi:hypothetical protein